MNEKTAMLRAIRIARQGSGCVSPNPMVGCVVLRGGRIAAEGFHAYFGGPHAEQAALARLHPRKTGDATLFVTLEPCDHYGKTPPCTDAILKSGIRRVVVGARDPNPAVSGRGIRKLIRSGVEVVEGVLESDCRALNEAYEKYMLRRTPFVTLKLALSLDGNIATATGSSRWITGEQARRWVHRTRAGHDSILVGIGTVLADDPKLTVRMASPVRRRARPPRRIVLDSRARIPLDSALLTGPDPGRTIVACVESAPEGRKLALEKRGAKVWVLPAGPDGKVSIRGLLTAMHKAEIASVLVEGGSGVSTSFLKSGEADRMVLFYGPLLVGRGKHAFGDFAVRDIGKALRFRAGRWQRFGSDMAFFGEKPCLPE